MDARSSSGVAGVFSRWFNAYCLFSPPKSGMYQLATTRQFPITHNH